MPALRDRHARWRGSFFLRIVHAKPQITLISHSTMQQHSAQNFSRRQAKTFRSLFPSRRTSRDCGFFLLEKKLPSDNLTIIITEGCWQSPGSAVVTSSKRLPQALDWRRDTPALLSVKYHTTDVPRGNTVLEISTKMPRR